MRRFLVSGIGDVRADSFNQFGHASELASPEATFVSINNDTLYSIAQIDLSGGPVRLDVPDSSGRYYVLQFVDAWTNNFATLGSIDRNRSRLLSAGPTQPVTLDATISLSGDGRQATVSATFDVDRTTFGMTWSPLHMAAPAARIAVHLVFHHTNS